MTTIHQESAAQRGTPDQHRELHVGPVRQADFSANLPPPDAQRCLDDVAPLRFSIRAGYPANINMNGLAFVADTVPVDGETHKALTITLELFENMGVKRGGARARIDFGGNTRQAELRQVNKLAPADNRQQLCFIHGQATRTGPTEFS